MSEQTQQSTITPELQFDVQLRAAALEQAIRVATATGNANAETLTTLAVYFLSFLRTGVAVHQGE